MQNLSILFLLVAISFLTFAQSNSIGRLNQNDKLLWENEVGTTGYLNSDASLNGQSDNQDKNNIWVPNNRTESPLPE